MGRKQLLVTNIPIANKDRITSGKYVYLFDSPGKTFRVKERISRDEVQIYTSIFGFGDPVTINVHDCNLDFRYGWFSEKAWNMWGGSYYLNDIGAQIAITAVTRTPEYDDYKWDDKRCIGIVFEHVRPVHTTYSRGFDEVLRYIY